MSKNSKQDRGNHMSADKSQATTAEQSTPIELTKIHVDYSWNTRSQKRVEDLATTESAGFQGFGGNIRASGQITPVILRNTNGRTLAGGKTDKPYELVVGFRRMRAVTLLNEKNEAERAKSEGRNNVPNLPNGTILAAIRNIDNVVAARILNGQENTLRTNLTAPDMVYLVKDLLKADMTQQVVADSLGITQGWVSKLAKVATLPPAVLAHWRDGTPIPPVTLKDGIYEIKKGDNTKELTEPEMRGLAELKGTPEEITARYIRQAKPPVAQGDGPGTADVPKDKVLEEIVGAATLMGCMVRAGVLENGNLDWTRVIGPKKKGYPLDCGKNDTADRLGALADAAKDAFDAAVTKGARGVEESA